MRSANSRGLMHVALGSLSNDNGDGNENVTNLHI